jgi:hypothetical protein
LTISIWQLLLEVSKFSKFAGHIWSLTPTNPQDENDKFILFGFSWNCPGVSQATPDVLPRAPRHPIRLEGPCKIAGIIFWRSQGIVDKKQVFL